MRRQSLLALVALTMVAFASNSLICRAALEPGRIDAASFTLLRLAAGALALGVPLMVTRAPYRGVGSGASALALLVYAAGFSFAYLGLSAATGALLLFCAVQVTMVGHALLRGERLGPSRTAGLLLALGGLLALLRPGLAAPPLSSALLMLAAGAAWGVYSLRGVAARSAAPVTAGNFVRAALLSLPLWLFHPGPLHATPSGIAFALVSGALASAPTYVLWYRLLPRLSTTGAATVQLSVPLLTALGGVVLLGEPLTLRLLLCGAAILGGIALVMHPRAAAGSAGL